MFSGLAGKRILVTGAAGFIATAVVEMLAEVDCKLRLVSRRPPSAALGATVETVQADVRDGALWDVILRDVDCVLHFAAQTSLYVANSDPLADRSGPASVDESQSAVAERTDHATGLGQDIFRPPVQVTAQHRACPSCLFHTCCQ